MDLIHKEIMQLTTISHTYIFHTFSKAWDAVILLYQFTLLSNEE